MPRSCLERWARVVVPIGLSAAFGNKGSWLLCTLWREEMLVSHLLQRKLVREMGWRGEGDSVIQGFALGFIF